MTDILQDAIVTKDTEMLAYLLTTGINVNKVLSDGRAPLNTAIAIGDDVIISLIMAADADVEVQDSFRVDGARLQPIHYAAIHNRLDLIQLFLSRGINTDHPDEGNCTPLHHASKQGSIDIVLYLVEAGSDINWQSNSGRTPLWKAAQGGHRDLVQLLYAMGADLDLPNKVGETVLFECITLDCLLPITRDLINFGIDVSVRDIEGNTALHKAASHGRSKACRVLIEARIDVDVTNEYGNTALHNAAMQNQVSVMVTLLNHCTRMTSRNQAGHSPLYVAMLHQQTNTTRLLHRVGARLTTTEYECFMRYEAHKNDKKIVFWRWCVELFGSPQRLTVLCLSVIRNRVIETGRVIQGAVSGLRLPRTLERSLLLDGYDLETDAEIHPVVS